MMCKPFPFLNKFLFVVMCCCLSSGCGGGKTAPDTNPNTFDYIGPAGHFRGVMYASATPAAGEPPLYLLDFVQHNGTDTIPYPYNDPTLSTYQSPDGKIKGETGGLFVYTKNNKIPLVTFVFTERQRSELPLEKSLSGAFYPVFGPPTNNGTHFEGYFQDLLGTDGHFDPNSLRHKAVLDIVP